MAKGCNSFSFNKNLVAITWTYCNIVAAFASCMFRISAVIEKVIYGTLFERDMFSSPLAKNSPLWRGRQATRKLETK